jgi:hypothetical protein
VHVDGGPISDDGHTDGERSYMVSHRWWSMAAWQASGEPVYPPDIIDMWHKAIALRADSDGMVNGGEQARAQVES